ncbi:MAG: short-chain dehydrogenase/reductase [Ilumatobacteraceae bacterium]|nr:short-chain dehydrogenase/reductase [Ilumatobacteraceae bacterium]
MESFAGKIAVVTGGGTGMGRELVRQLAAEGCHVATCDVSADNMADTLTIAEAGAPAGTRVTSFVADVSDRAQLDAFAADVREQQSTDHINLLFNNAGIGAGGSFVLDPPEEWDKTFAICWGGVYGSTRAFLPLLLASDAGHVINTSSVNGFWASLGPGIPHTAYCSAKFAVKGFTEALIADFAVNAPHLRASVVMPGHIGTSIVLNSGSILGRNPKELTEDQLQVVRDRTTRMGLDLSGASDEDLRQGMQAQAESFRDNAPMTAAQAATVILDGVRTGEWRILVGEDAFILDEMVRARPEEAYGQAFANDVRARGVFTALTGG